MPAKNPYGMAEERALAREELELATKIPEQPSGSPSGDQKKFTAELRLIPRGAGLSKLFQRSPRLRVRLLP